MKDLSKSEKIPSLQNSLFKEMFNQFGSLKSESASFGASGALNNEVSSYSRDFFMALFLKIFGGSDFTIVYRQIIEDFPILAQILTKIVQNFFKGKMLDFSQAMF